MEFEPNGPSVRFFRQINNTARGHAVAMIAELVGTTMFLFFSYAAAQIGNEKVDTLRPLLEQPGPSLLQISYISAVFGVSLGVNVWIFYRVSGGMFNPAVSRTGLAPLNPPSPFFFSLREADEMIGVLRALDGRGIRLGSSCLRRPDAICRGHCCCWLSIGAAARTTTSRECSLFRCDNSTGTFPRDDSHCRANHDYHHVGRREEPDVFHGTTGYRLGPLRRPSHR